MSISQSIASRRARHPRNLIILRAGDSSLHPQWISSGPCDFDLLISYYGKSPGRYVEQAQMYEGGSGRKWPCISALLDENAAVVAGYDAVWFPDDDLAADTAV